MALHPGVVVVVLTTALVLAGCTNEPSEPEAPTAVPMIIVTLTPGPSPTPTLAPSIDYTVAPGDTISGIASRFGVSEDDLMRANNMTDPTQLKEGQHLLVPGAAR